MSALDWLLSVDRWHHEIDGTPFECSDCPFATPETTLHDPPNPADLGEGHYDCALLGRTGKNAVWGECPECEPSDWTAAARRELAEERGRTRLLAEALARISWSYPWDPYEEGESVRVEGEGEYICTIVYSEEGTEYIPLAEEQRAAWDAARLGDVPTNRRTAREALAEYGAWTKASA